MHNSYSTYLDSCTLTLLLWQYSVYVVDSVNSGQAIITSHRHSPMHTILMHHAYIMYHTIPILSPSFFIFPLFNS